MLSADELWQEMIAHDAAEMVDNTIKSSETQAEHEKPSSAEKRTSSYQSPPENLTEALRIVDFTSEAKSPDATAVEWNKEGKVSIIPGSVPVQDFTNFLVNNRRYPIDSYGYLSLFPLAFPDLCLVAMYRDRIVGILKPTIYN